MAGVLDLTGEFRSNRFSLSNDVVCENYPLTLFLGVYNGKSFLSQVEMQIANQNDLQFQLLIADNNSSDESLEFLKRAIFRFPVHTRLVRNPINVGFHGSLKLNRDLITSPWVGIMNQDDHYLQSHTAELNSLISNARDTTVAVGTVLGSLSPSGSRLASPPRAAWYLNDDFARDDLICATVAQHILPEPSMAYRASILDSVSTPWHSTAFPDTEMLLEALCFGSIQVSKVETVLYRESPNSASHHLNAIQRTNGAFISLMRYFNGSHFLSFAATIAKDRRESFANKMVRAISARLDSRPESDVCTIAFLESLTTVWGYDETAVTLKLAEVLSNQGSHRASDLLVRLANYSHPEVEVNNFQGDGKALEITLVATQRRRLLWMYQRVAIVIPQRMIRKAWLIFLRSGRFKGRLATWRFLQEDND
jgi:hypothetical protein